MADVRTRSIVTISFFGSETFSLNLRSGATVSATLFNMSDLNLGSIDSEDLSLSGPSQRNVSPSEVSPVQVVQNSKPVEKPKEMEEEKSKEEEKPVEETSPAEIEITVEPEPEPEPVPEVKPTEVKDEENPPSSRKGSKLPRPPKPIELDDVLVNELGQFGRFQLNNIILVAIPLAMSAFMSEYIFSAGAIPHRCQVHECGENSKDNLFEPTWLPGAIPVVGSGYASCERYEPVGLNGTLDQCPANLFTTNLVGCEGFVYARDNSVVYDFDLGCQEWLRALAGTLNSVGTLLVLPIIGFISDKYGRRVALIISVFNLALIGLIRAFSVNYPMYLTLQILQTTLGAGTFSSAYIFAAEMVGPKYRVITSAITSSMFAVGQIILGGVAWIVQPWRYMIMTLHIPCFLIILYYWVLYESVRWLLSKRKYDEAREVLEKVAKVNKKKISEKSLEGLLTPPPQDDTNPTEGPGLVSQILKSPTMIRRVATTPIWWITTTFVYYGLSINSTSLSDTMYLNYILICAIEIPGSFTSVLILDRIGRKATLSIGYFFSAACCIAFVFVDQDMETLRLILFLAGKFGISVVFTSLYLYTSELYPTQYRHTLLAFSSMIGRIGSITAPLTPVLADYWHGIPSLMFGIMGVISGILVLTQPETLGRSLPDTIADAEAIGKTPKKTYA